MKRLVVAGLMVAAIAIGLATHNIGYYDSTPEYTQGNQGVYAGIGTDWCVGYEFKPFAGFFVGCE